MGFVTALTDMIYQKWIKTEEIKENKDANEKGTGQFIGHNEALLPKIEPPDS